MRRPLGTLTAAALAGAAAAGCATAPGGPAGPPHTSSAPPPATTLTATLDTPNDITLRWRDRDPDAAVRVLEYATERHGEYVPLAFLRPGRTRFTHPDLMPDTTFSYRLRALHGPASRAVHVTLPRGGPGERDRERDPSWAEPRRTRAGQGRERPLRNGTASGAPTGLTATPRHADGVLLTWVDHAADEDGHLVEVRRHGASAYRVVAVLDPDVTSTGVVTLPDERTADYRVRAFRYGAPSNVVHRTTGTRPPT
ncbi:fibronectin type III domain-containing protein [Streptomyces sp. G45]|uniref:fibronectin type III domain-containing protein n=1 Tax=Streptomyces sp. G45 TaxID=3406627 RepID=UPI003C1F581F